MTLAVLALTGVALYTLAGFFLAPRLLERKLEAMIEEQTHLTLAIGAAAVNPFTLTVSFDKVTLFRPENTPAVSLERLHARVQLSDIVSGAWVLRDAVVHALEIADPDGGGSMASARSVDFPEVVVETTPARVSIDTARIVDPRIRLRRGPQGALNLPDDLLSLLPGPGAGKEIRYTIANGRVAFEDQSIAPRAQLSAWEINGSIGRQQSADDIMTALALEGRLAETGAGSVTAQWYPSQPLQAMRVDLEVQDLDLPEISTYVRQISGQRVLAGRMDLILRIERDEARLDLASRLVVRDFRYGGPTVTSHLPLAVALLEDNDGVIDLQLPVQRRSAAGTVPAMAYDVALREYLSGIAGSPFVLLGSLVSRPDLDLGSFSFLPGSADTTEDSLQKISALDQALSLRPKLGFVVYPGFAPDADRNALARQQIRLHVNLATSEITPTQAAGKAIDFDDPQVQSVLDEFGGNRLPAAQWTSLNNRFADQATARYPAVLAALIDHEKVRRSALDRLARYRARAIVGAVLTAGNNASRIRMAETVVPAGSDNERRAVVRLEAEAVTTGE